jgi:hypothetical protein
MSRLSSFIFSSDNARRIQVALRLGVWIAIGLTAFDVLINVVFAYPSDPRNTNPSRFQIYFEYGRSTDAQLARMTRHDRSQTAPITLAGWYNPITVEEKSETTQNPIVTFYGMSHAVQLAHALARVSNAYTPRVVGAPGATANWAYGAYLRDRGGAKSRAVVLALMSANLPMITTMSPMTWNIGFPMPYTEDRFFIDNGKLLVVHPPYESFEQYVETFHDQAKWTVACELFAKYDTMYSPFIREASFLDHSSLFRLLRRAYGQRLERSARAGVLDQSGFHPDSEQIKVARAIIRDFSQHARADRMIPIIYIVNNFGYSDYLFQALKPVLDADNIPYVSSHQIVSPNDPRGYVPNSHFTDLVDEQLARALINVIKMRSDIK